MTLEPKEFPLQTQIGTFENEQDVEQWILTNQDTAYPFDYGYLIKASQVIYSPEIEEYLVRYKMQKEYNIFSYSQNFDEIPADWIDMLNYMDVCVNEALEEKKRLGNH
jgi:hypothetical protein